MSEFVGLAEYYDKFRPGVPANVAKTLLDLVPPSNRTGLLDLGTGTGQVVVAIGSSFRHVNAVDPDPEMLNKAQLAVSRKGIHAQFFEATAEQFLMNQDVSADLVTISRAFHWMDRPRVLEKLEDVVASQGTVVSMSDHSFWNAGNPWQNRIKEVIQSFLGPERRSGVGVFAEADAPELEVFRQSTFSSATEIKVPVRRVWSIDDVLGYLYSTSFAGKRHFGASLSEFEAAAYAELRPFLDAEGLLEEYNEFVLTVGQRPTALPNS